MTDPKPTGKQEDEEKIAFRKKVDKVLSEIQAGVFRESGSSFNFYIDYEAVLRKACRYKGDPGGFPLNSEELEVIGSVLTSSDLEFGTWSHKVCHQFEHYPESSLLNNAETFPLAIKLMDETIKRGNVAGAIRNSSVIFGVAAEYMLDNLSDDMMELPIQLTAGTKERSQFAAYFGVRFPECAAFLTASNPKDFLLNLIRLQAGGLIVKRYDKFQHLISILEREMSVEELNTIIPAGIGDAGITTFDEILKRIRMAHESLAMGNDKMEKGLFVDVDGTLIVDGKLNQKVLEDMERSWKRVEPITIITGGKPGEQKKLLRKLGVPKEFLFAVHSKSKYVGKRLETLIDDTSPAFQGFSAKYYEKP